MKPSINDKQSKPILSRTSSASSFNSRNVLQNTAQTTGFEAINLYAPLVGQAQSAAVYHMNRADELVGQVINESSLTDYMTNMAINESSRADYMTNMAINESSRADHNAYIASSLLQENLMLKQHLEKINMQQTNVQSVPVNTHATDTIDTESKDTQKKPLSDEEKAQRKLAKKARTAQVKAEKEKEKQKQQNLKPAPVELDTEALSKRFASFTFTASTKTQNLKPVAKPEILAIGKTDPNERTEAENIKTQKDIKSASKKSEASTNTLQQKQNKKKNKKIKNNKADDNFDFDTLIAQEQEHIQRYQEQEKEQILALLQADINASDKDIYKKFKKIRKELPLMEALSIQNERGNTLLHNITANNLNIGNNCISVLEIFKNLSTEKAISCLKMTNNEKKTPMEHMLFIWDFKTIDIALEKMNDTQIKDLIHGTDQQVNQLIEMLAKYDVDTLSKKYDTEFLDTFGNFCNEIIGNYDRYRAKSR